MNDTRASLRTWLDLLTMSNTLKKSIDTMLRAEFGVSIARFDVMAALDRAGPEGLRAGELSQRLMVTDGNTTQVAAPLIRDGLICRRASLKDKRVAILRLTRKGDRLFTQMAESHRQWVSGAFADFDETQLEALRALLTNIRSPAATGSVGKDAA